MKLVPLDDTTAPKGVLTNRDKMRVVFDEFLEQYKVLAMLEFDDEDEKNAMLHAGRHIINESSSRRESMLRQIEHVRNRNEGADTSNMEERAARCRYADLEIMKRGEHVYLRRKEGVRR